MKKYRCKVNGYFDFEQNKVYTEKEIGIFIKNKRDWEIITDKNKRSTNTTDYE